MSRVFVRAAVPKRVPRDFPSKGASPLSQRLELLFERPLAGVCSRWIRNCWTRTHLPAVHLLGNAASPPMAQAREGTFFSTLLQRTKKHISTPVGPRRVDVRQWETKPRRPLRIKAQRMNVTPREEPEREQASVPLFFLLFFLLFFSRFLQAYTSTSTRMNTRMNIDHYSCVFRASLVVGPLSLSSTLFPFPFPSAALTLAVPVAGDCLSLVPVLLAGAELVPRSETSARHVPLSDASYAPLILRSMLRDNDLFLKVLEGLGTLVGKRLTGPTSIVRVDGGDMVQLSRAYASIYDLDRDKADGVVLEPTRILAPWDMVGVGMDFLGVAEAFTHIFWSLDHKTSLLDALTSVVEHTHVESSPSGQVPCGEVIIRPRRVRRVRKRTCPDDLDLCRFVCNELCLDFEAAEENDGETCGALDPAFIATMFQAEDLTEFMNFFGEVPGVVPDWDAVASATPLFPLTRRRGGLDSLETFETFERRVAHKYVRTDSFSSESSSDFSFSGENHQPEKEQQDEENEDDDDLCYLDQLAANMRASFSPSEVSIGRLKKPSFAPEEIPAKLDGREFTDSITLGESIDLSSESEDGAVYDKPLDPAFIASILDGDEIEEFMEIFRHVKSLLPDREAVDDARPVVGLLGGAKCRDLHLLESRASWSTEDSLKAAASTLL